MTQMVMKQAVRKARMKTTSCIVGENQGLVGINTFKGISIDQTIFFLSGGPLTASESKNTSVVQSLCVLCRTAWTNLSQPFPIEDAYLYLFQ